MAVGDFQNAVAEALGPLAKSPENREGGEAFYEVQPYEHATPEVAIAQARTLQGLV